VRQLIRRLAAVIAVVLVVAGCGINSDSAPRDINSDRQGELAEFGRPNNQAPAGGSRIFLVDAASAQNPVVRAVARDVPARVDTLITALLEGPTVSERARRLRTAIPAGTELLDWRYEAAGQVTLNLSANILDASGDSLVAAVAQIVYTLNEFDLADGVRLLVEGEARQWPTGDGTLTS
jgi:spore germination protein GerM